MMQEQVNEIEEILVFDIECNGFLRQATCIHCIVIAEFFSGKFTRYTGPDIAVAILRLLEADKIVGHNVITFDIPVIEKLAAVSFDRAKAWDTLVMSRLYFPERTADHSNHGLGAWGKTLGVEKGNYKDFSRLTPEMLDYCEQDVRVNVKILETILARIAETEAAGYAA